MAVWMQLFGNNKNYKNLEFCEQYFHSIKDNLKLDFSFLESQAKDHIRQFMNGSELITKIEKPISNYSIYNNENWKSEILKNDNGDDYLNISYPLYENPLHGINLCFFNDVIMLTGLYEHFNTWFAFYQNEKVSNGFIEIARTIFPKFGSENLIICSEWCISGDEYDFEFEEFKLLKERNADIISKKLIGIESWQLFEIDLK